MLGVLLFMALGFIVGWAVQHPLAWAVLMVPVLFALVAGNDVAVLPAILGVVLMAAAFYGGRMLARRTPPDGPAEESPGNRGDPPAASSTATKPDPAVEERGDDEDAGEDPRDH